jgi:hypothetical protein
MKATLLVCALTAVLISFAAGQDFNAPQASLDPEPATASSLARPAHIPGPPTYCKPCLFYAGDFDSNASDANGLPNEVDLIVSTGAAAYTPFIVPKGKTWTVTGLFTNNFMSNEVIDPKIIPYEVRKGIPKAGGNGGQLVCHGKRAGTLVPLPLTVCQGAFGFECYATKVNGIKSCRLPAGKYWMSVVPYCTNKNDNRCSAYRAFLQNDDGAMAHRYGSLEPADNSFFNSKFYGANWDPSSKWQTSKRFSAGVEGTEK